MDQHVAPAHGVDQLHAQQATEHEDDGDCHRAPRRQVTGKAHGRKDLRGEGVDGELRDDRAGPEHADEEDALAIAGVEQRPDRHLACRRRFGQVGDGEAVAINPFHHLVGLFDAPLAQQPTGRFRSAGAHDQEQHARHRRARQGPAPGFRPHAAQDELTGHIGHGSTDEPHHHQAGENRTPLLARQELGQQRSRQWVVGTNGDTQSKAQGNQRGS
ncbi:hypothetical protein D3C75_531930 [compost metagenome]